MHLRVLSQWLEDRAVIRHGTRASALARAVRALLTSGKLSLTHLGRSLDGEAKEKHQIKSVDRLLGNRHLHRERDAIYAAIARTLLLGNLRPVIIVDGPISSSVGSGRCSRPQCPWAVAISVYERVFPFRRYNSPGAHRELLIGTLASLVVWLVGLAGRATQRHRELQANTERRREVLSTFFIGRQLLRRVDDLPDPRFCLRYSHSETRSLPRYPPELRGDPSGN